MAGTILLISQAFPPDPLVGALRAGNVALAFSEAGYRVIVVTAAMEGEVPGLREWQPGITVHTVAVGRRYRERLTPFMRKLQSLVGRHPLEGRRDIADVEPDSTPDTRPGSGGRLRALLLSLVWIPDDELRFVFPAYKAARRLLRERIDLVYTSAPSHSTNLLGLLLRRFHRVRWCAEFRDPWCYPHGFPITPLVEPVNRYLEKRCIEAADYLVTVTDQAAELYRQRLGPAASKVVVVRNGIPVLSPRPSRREGDPFRIVYSGSLYGARDPRAFLRAVADVSQDSGAGAVPLVVDIFVVDAHGDMSLDANVAQLGIGATVRVHEWLPHAEIQAVLREADLLLLLAQNQPLQVPNKLYEYLGTGVPILAIADEQGETARMLRQVGGHYVVAQDSATEIAVAIRAALNRQAVPPTARAREVLDDWLTERQMRRLITAVGP
jgi:glycosyltransferase involved in cell wall biosynthesis